MTDLSNVKALAWDIGGTIFDWHHTIKGEVSAIAEAQGVELDAAAFTNMWRFTMFKRLQLVRRGDLPWLNADQLHRRVLDEVMDAYPQLKLDPSERDELNQVWHRMNAWPGSAECLEALRSRYKVTVLTVMSWAIAVDCSKHNGISWDGILSCEFLGHYKPEPEAYHASARYLGLDISEVMMCAAHKGDPPGRRPSRHADRIRTLGRRAGRGQRSGSDAGSVVHRQRDRLCRPVSQLLA